MPRLDRDMMLRTSAWALVCLGSLLNLLNHNEYPLLSHEVLLSASLVAAAAILIGLVHRLALPRLSFIFTALLLALAADFNSGSPGLVLAAFAVGLVGAWLREQVVLKLVSAAFAGVIFFQLLQGHWTGTQTPVFAQSGPGRADLPPVVHIVFDAYLGIEGMDADPAVFGRLKQANAAFFARHGFRLYEGAYSEHRNTANSLPQIFSFGGAPLPQTPQRVQRSVPGELAYFTMLRDRGYRTHVLQTDYIDVCASQRIASCLSYRRSDLSAIAQTELSVRDRVAIIAATLINLAAVPRAISDTFLAVRGRWSGAEEVDVEHWTKLFPIASLKAMRSFEAAVAKAQPGHAYVAHLLMPHDPFFLDENCRMMPRREWAFQEAPASLSFREQRYARQMLCVLARTDRLLAALARSRAGKDAIVILHGDHGSRITDGIPEIEKPPVSPRELGMTYSTLFAVKGPAIGPGREPGRAAVEHLLGQFTHSGFRRAPSAGAGVSHVVLTDRTWIPRRQVPLPAYRPPLTHN